MDFLEIEESVVSTKKDMPCPHSHDYYELYFLLDGTREFFIGNKMFVIGKNSLVIVPPFYMHKTEGGPYKRINVNISENLLSEGVKRFIKGSEKETAISFCGGTENLVSPLLKEGVKIQRSAMPYKTDCLLSLVKTLLYVLAESENRLIPAASGVSARSSDTETLKIVRYINENYTSELTLSDICANFYISKVTLCNRFRAAMHCSVKEYIQSLRINKARELLSATDKSMEEISRLCGFSSANYFGLAFKKETGLSPFNYKKSR